MSFAKAQDFLKIHFDIVESSSIEFKDISLSEQDFHFVSKGAYYLAEVTAPWSYISNEQGSKYSLYGKLSQKLPSGASFEAKFDPPKDKQGFFGTVEANGSYIPLTTRDTKFLSDLSKGRVGNSQNQYLKIKIDENLFLKGAGSTHRVVLSWTLSDS